MYYSIGTFTGFDVTWHIEHSKWPLDYHATLCHFEVLYVTNCH